MPLGLASPCQARTINQATCDLLGYKEEELLGKNINLIVPQQSLFMGTEAFGVVPIVNQEMDYLAKSGKRIPVRFSAAALKNKESKIIASVIIARDVAERKQAEEALRHSEKQLRFLSSQLLIAQEIERKRLSVELHDELGQSLMVLKLLLRTIQRELREDQTELKGNCDEMTSYINEINENVRRLSRDLSPSILVDLGLSAAIRWLVVSFTKRFNIQNSLDIMDLDTVFSEANQITVYRIVQESLTNIIRHARTDKADVLVVYSEDELRVRVEDAGCGFDVSETLHKPGHQCWGLLGMIERAALIGGDCQFVSEPGMGTIVELVAPLKEKPDGKDPSAVGG